MDKFKYDVFISHSSEDILYIEKMRKCLEEVNIRCWVSYLSSESEHKSKIYEVSLIPPKFNKSSKALAKLYELYERHEGEE